MSLSPLFLIKPGTMSRADIRRAERLAGVCVVECAEPESARYSEVPMDAKLDVQARAALSLLRTIVRAQQFEFKRGELTKWFIEALLTGEQSVRVQPVPVAKAK